MSLQRTCFTLDPVWCTVDVGVFQESWARLCTEARGCGFVGVDLEWTTTEQLYEEAGVDGVCFSVQAKRVAGPIATVQLSTFSVSLVIKFCDLFKLASGVLREDPMGPTAQLWPNHRMGEKNNKPEALEMILDNLKEFLQDDSVVKVGVGIHGDRAKIEADYPGMKLFPCVDLVSIAETYVLDSVLLLPRHDEEELVKVPTSKVRSLKDMCAAFANRTLVKDISIVKSDWGGSLGALSSLQVSYAAADAEASFDVCCGILSRENPLFQDAPVSWAEKLLMIGEGDLTMERKGRRKAFPRSSQLEEDPEAKDIGWCKGRSKPYYDNINVLNPSNELVFTVDKSKALWYVDKKGLAKVIEWRDPPHNTEIASIQLAFSPDFRKYNDAHIRRNLDYFKSPKENVCVVCGCGEQLVRFAVVPLMYRKYFPSVYMSHNSYDLLLLCTVCFAKSRSRYNVERQKVAEDFGIPLTHATPRGVAEFESLIEQMESNMDQLVEEYSSCADDGIAHQIHPQLKIKGMKEYVDIERHRDCIINIFKYAKALRTHYEASGSSGIPPERLSYLGEYVSQHAPGYPFAQDTELQERVFDEFGVLSREGVNLILGETDGSGFRNVLTRYWIREHPEILEVLPETTRANEREGDIEETGTTSLDCDEVPLVDSHGFLVVKMLMEKYSPLFQKCRDDETTAKTSDHAVGQFIFRWRRTFLDRFQPQYLPAGWVPDDGILL